MIGTSFPAAGSRLNNTTYTAGCVVGTSEVCGTTSDSPSGVAKVEISLQRSSTGLYLTGTTFSAASQTWITTTGTTSWSYALAPTTFPAEDTYTMVVRATDSVGNVSTSSRPFVIDRTKPVASGLSTTNAGIVRRLEVGDTFTLTWNEAIDPASILAGWNGTTTQSVVVRGTNSTSNDSLKIYNSTNTALLPLGTLSLSRGDYYIATATFGATGTPSTMTMSGNSVTITLGTPSVAMTTAAAAANMSWTPSKIAADLAGNASATTAYVETDLDSDF